MRGTPSDAQASRPGDSPSARSSARPATGDAGSTDRASASSGGPVLGWLVVLVPMLAELVVDGYRIGTPSLWRDEAATISGSQRPLGDLLAMIGNQDAVHGFYYLLMHPVIAVGGISATTLRLPSLIAMCLTAGLTAALGRRLARASAIPGAHAVGLLAGLALVAVPLTTRYAQEARPYALTSLFAVVATYLLVRAAARPAWSAWVGYAVALVVTGLFSLFAVLIAVAHGVSLWWGRGRPDGPVTAVTWRRWLSACLAAAVLLAPVAYLSAGQASQISWVTKPTASSVASLLRDFAGATTLIPLVVVLVLLGCAAGRGVHRASGLNLATVALPWLFLPPVVLIAVSFVRPVYVERYVVFCLPALSILTAAGLVWLTVLARRFLAGRGLGSRPGSSAPRVSTGGSAGSSPRVSTADVLAIVPAAVLVLAIVAVLIAPQRAIRQAGSRPDNLRAVAAIVDRHERPGDAIVYLPQDTELASVAYPAPYRHLRDIGLGRSPDASGTLRGVPASPAVVAARLRTVPRLWTVQWAHALGKATAVPASLARLLTSMRLIRTWRVQSVVLHLYAGRRS